MQEWALESNVVGLLWLTEVYATCRPGTGGIHLSLLPRRMA